MSAFTIFTASIDAIAGAKDPTLILKRSGSKIESIFFINIISAMQLFGKFGHLTQLARSYDVKEPNELIRAWRIIAIDHAFSSTRLMLRDDWRLEYDRFRNALTPRDKYYLHLECIGSALMVILLITGILAGACFIVFLILQFGYVVPADNLAARLHPAICRIDATPRFTMSSCKFGAQDNVPCVVVTIPYNVTQAGHSWIARYDEQYDSRDVLELERRKNEFWPVGKTRGCFTDGSDLEFNLHGVESKRKSARICLWIILVVVIYSVFTLIWHIWSPLHRCGSCRNDRPRHNGQYVDLGTIATQN